MRVMKKLVKVMLFSALLWSGFTGYSLGCSNCVSSLNFDNKRDILSSNNPGRLSGSKSAEEYIYCISVVRGVWVQAVSEDGVTICNDPYNNNCWCESLVR